MNTGRYVYRLECGDLLTGPDGLPVAREGTCGTHGPSRIAGPGIPLSRLLGPDRVPGRDDT